MENLYRRRSNDVTQFDRSKLKALILYAASKCSPSQLGAVKLHKLLYYSDMLHYADVGTPITGATYRKRPYGPTCDSLLPVLRELEQAGAIKIRKVDYFGYSKAEYEAIEKPDLSRFSNEELSLVNEVIEFVCSENTAKTISELSHALPWEMVEFGDALPYHNALHLFPNQVTPDAFAWAEGEAGDVAATKSTSSVLDYEDFAAFRSRVLQARNAP
jgi:hypothetical protein